MPSTYVLLAMSTATLIVRCVGKLGKYELAQKLLALLAGSRSLLSVAISRALSGEIYSYCHGMCQKMTRGVILSALDKCLLVYRVRFLSIN